MFNHGTITAMLFLLVGVIYDRAHHRDINGFGGLASIMPLYTGVTGFAFFAAMGIPGLSAFISEVLVLLGAWQRRTRRSPSIAASAVVLTAGYMLWALQRMYLGAPNPKYATTGLGDQRPRALHAGPARGHRALPRHLPEGRPRPAESAARSRSREQVKAAAPAARVGDAGSAPWATVESLRLFVPELVLTVGDPRRHRRRPRPRPRSRANGPARSPSSPPSSRSSRRCGCRACWRSADCSATSAVVALRPHGRARRRSASSSSCCSASRCWRRSWMSLRSPEVRGAAERGRVLHVLLASGARHVPDGVGGEPADGLPVARVRQPHVVRPDGLPAPQPALGRGRA